MNMNQITTQGKHGLVIDLKHESQENRIPMNSPLNPFLFSHYKSMTSKNGDKQFGKHQVDDLGYSGFASTGFETDNNFRGKSSDVNKNEKAAKVSSTPDIAAVAFNSFSLFHERDPLTKVSGKTKAIKYIKGDKQSMPDIDFDTFYKFSPEFLLKSNDNSNFNSPEKLRLNSERIEINEKYSENIKDEPNKATPEANNNFELKKEIKVEEPVKYKYSIYCDENSACQIPEGRK